MSYPGGCRWFRARWPGCGTGYWGNGPSGGLEAFHGPSPGTFELEAAVAITRLGYGAMQPAAQEPAAAGPGTHPRGRMHQRPG
jgi:hypothetical protein